MSSVLQGARGAPAQAPSSEEEEVTISGAGAQEVHGQGNWAVWPLFRSIRSLCDLEVSRLLRGLTSAETSTAWSA